MERKIGEIFEHNGEWCQCIVGNDCENCAFNKIKCYTVIDNDDPIGDPIGDCCADGRKDNKNVIFKKLEKAGESYEHNEKFYQCYKLPMETEIRLLPNNCNPIGKDNLVEIEIKQNKEDMEEKKIQHYDCFFDGKPTLKEFDLEAAKAGKPVCIRDGHKARIICFDAKGMHQPIIALITQDTGIEYIETFYSNGRFNDDSNSQSDYDLMMLSEKKEGWILLRKDGCVFDNEEVAKKNCTDDYFVAKVEWKE